MQAVTVRQFLGRGFRALLFAALLCVALGALSLMPTSAKEVNGAYGSFSVKANIDTKQHNRIVVTAAFGDTFLEDLGGRTLFLFGLRSNEYGDALAMHTPLATAKAERKTTFTLEDDGTGEKYYLAYVMAYQAGEDYRALHIPITIENPEILSEKKAEKRECGSIKGIVSSGAYLGEVTELGVSHAVIPIVLDEYLSLDKSDAAYAVSFGGVMTNFDKTKIGQLDAHISALRRAGVHVTLRFLLDGSTRATNAPSAWLYADKAPEDASLYALTAEDKDAFLLLRGIFTYFAQRYGADEALDFIIGYSVNEGAEWNCMGEAGEPDYALEYAKVFKIAQTALLSTNRNGRVYVPISNLWISAKPFLEQFAKEMDGSAWHVAIAPYASDPMDDSVWTDTLAKNAETTTYITVHNLGVLKSFLENEELLLDGKRRRVIIDDFAVHADSGDETALERQAASLAYAYYSARNADFIDAFIYHRIADLDAEGTSLGLRAEDSTQKPAYRIYRSIDTSMGEKETKYLITIIGGKRWQNIISGFAPRDAVQVERFEATGERAEEALSDYERATYIEFLDGSLNGFLPYAHVSVVSPLKQSVAGTDLPETVLSFTSAEMPIGETAYIARSISDLKLKKADALALTLTVNGGGRITENKPQIALPSTTPATEGDGTPDAALSAPASAAITVILRIEGEKKGEKTVYEAHASVVSGDRTTVVFPIEDFARATKNAKTLWIGVTDASTEAAEQGNRQAAYTVTLDKVEYLTRKSSWVLVAFGCLFGILLVLVAAFGVLVLRKRILREKKRRAIAQRRAQLARMQAQREGDAPVRAGTQAPLDQAHTPQTDANRVHEARRRSASRTPQMRPPKQNIPPHDHRDIR